MKHEYVVLRYFLLLLLLPCFVLSTAFSHTFTVVVLYIDVTLSHKTTIINKPKFIFRRQCVYHFKTNTPNKMNEQQQQIIPEWIKIDLENTYFKVLFCIHRMIFPYPMYMLIKKKQFLHHVEPSLQLNTTFQWRKTVRFNICE